MIKKLDKKYTDEIIEIHKKAIYPLWDNLKREYSDEGVREFILTIFGKGEVYGYFMQNKIIGCVGLDQQGDAFEIRFLLVNPDFQGKGVGRELMSFVQKRIKGSAKKIFLEVLMKNPAVNFYKKIGYKIVKEKEGKYIMEKIL